MTGIKSINRLSSTGASKLEIAILNFEEERG